MLIYLLLSISIILTILDNCYSLSWFFIFIFFILCKIQNYFKNKEVCSNAQSEIGVARWTKEASYDICMNSINSYDLTRFVFSDTFFFNFLGVIFVFNLIVLYVDHRSDFKGSEISFSQTFLELVLMRKI